MGIKNQIKKRGTWLYKFYLYKNLFVTNKCFIKRKSYSQFQEDIFIQNFFSNTKSGVYVDIGCYHPIKYSNTAKLYSNSWRGYNIDINKTSIDLFKIARPNDYNFNICLDTESGKKIPYYRNGLFSAINSLDKKHLINFSQENIIEDFVFTEKFDNLVNEKFDFLNIDCEGYDFEILKLIDLNKYNPTMICIEIHNENDRSIHDYLKRCNYEFITNFSVSYIFRNLN